MMKEIVCGRSKSYHQQFTALLEAQKKQNKTVNCIVTQTVSIECGQTWTSSWGNSSVRQARAEDEWMVA